MIQAIKNYVESQHFPHPLYIDVRSEDEYQKDYLPSAINLPLLNNEERAHVGTVYKQESQEKAKQIGIDYVSQKLPDFFAEITSYIKDYDVFIYCKGGGYRSRSVVALLHALGEVVFQLEGGYKAYRKHVMEETPKIIKKVDFINLSGYTGVGKTEILAEIEKLGGQVLDLEGLANHRGSSFGAVGLGEQPSQKRFENLIYQKLSTFEAGPVFIESESNLIGKLYVPNALREAYKSSSHQVAITAPLEERIERIYEEYIKEKNVHLNEDIQKSLEALKRYIGKDKVKSLSHELEQGHYRHVIEFLMTDYYDNHYLIKKENYERVLDNQSPKASAKELMAYYATPVSSY